METNIFKIDQRLTELTTQIIEQGGEVTDQQAQELQITEAQLQGKAVSYGYVVKKLEYECDTIDAEIKRLQALKRSRVSTIERMKSTVSEAMLKHGIHEIKSATMKLNFRKSETCEIEDEKQLPAIYKTEVVTVKIDKAAIKKAIKDGESVSGAYIQEHENLQIK